MVTQKGVFILNRNITFRKGGSMAIKKDKSKESTKDSMEVKVDKKGKKVVTKEKKEKKEKKVGFLKRICTYFKEVKKEVSLVKWPSRKDMVKYSIATFSFVLFFALFFYLITFIIVTVRTWR